MARIRTVKPEFPQSESLGRVSRDARLLFIMLWTIADDFGKTRGSSRMLASLLFPYDDDAVQLLPGWLAELERQHCVELYTVDGNSYLQIKNWSIHQKIDHPSKSKFPDPPKGKPEDLNETREPLGNPREGSRDFLEESRGLAKSSARTWTKEGTKEGTKEVPLPNGNGCDAPPGGSGGLVEHPLVGDQPTAKPEKLDPWVAIYARGKAVLGQHAGGTITTLRKLYDDKPRKVLAKIEDAAEQREPARWLYAFLNKVDHGGKLSGHYIGGIPP